MAKKASIARAIAGDSNINKMGSFQESTGGGTPLKKGEKLKDHPEAHRESQPKDEKGRFTYNAVNGKGLKYGPSRGTTISPLLKGVKLTYAIKTDTVINYNGLTHLAGINATSEEFIEMFRNIDDLKKLLEETAERKKGRKSNREKEFISKGNEGIIEKENEEAHKIGNIGNRAKVFSDNREIVASDEKEFLSNFGKCAKNAENHKVVKLVFRPIGPSGPNGPNKPSGPNKPNGNDGPSGGNNPPDNSPNGDGNQPKNQPNNNGGATNNNNNNNNGGGNFDSTLAKSSPKQFFENNKGLVKDVMNTIPGLTAAKAVAIIASGKFKNLEELKTYYNSKKQK